MCGGSAAEARRQCDGRAIDGRPKCIRRVSVRICCASVVCPSRARRPSVRPKEGLFRPYDGWTAAARRTDDGCATVAREPRVRRLSAVQPPRSRHKAEISLIYFGLMTDGRRARGGQTTDVRRPAARPPHLRRTSANSSSVRARSRRPSVIRPK